MSILKELSEKKGFTQVERSIAEYILEHPDELATLGIAELARQTYSSNAAIIRMCRKLNISGYKEFRIAFASDLERTRRENPDVDVNYPFAQKEGANSIMRSIANISASAIEDTYAMLQPAALTRAAHILRAARRIYLYGAGDSLATTEAFANLLLKLGHVSIFPARYLESMQHTAVATDRDAALIVTYSGNFVSTLKREVQMLKRNRTPLIVLSSVPECPSADLLLRIPDRESVVGKVSWYFSQTAIRYALSCLYSMIYAIDMEKNRQFKDEADSYSYGREGE